MVCVYCGAKTQVTNSRAQKRNNQIWRRRLCNECQAVFTTHEAADLSGALSVDYGAYKRPFMADMLFTELLLALQDRKDNYLAAREVTNTVIQQLLKAHPGTAVRPVAISHAASKVLKRLDRQAWLRYIAEHPSLQKAKVTS